VVAEGFVTNNPRLPADAAADEHLTALREMLEDLGERYVKRCGNQFGCPMKETVDVVTPEGEEPKVR
jgi:hypothetical protein